MDYISSMITLHRTTSENPDFIGLVQLLDADLTRRDGADNAYYAQFNKIDKLKQVVVAYENDHAVGCGAFKEFAPRIFEVKRMYTCPESRGKGIAGQILGELEQWAAEFKGNSCILETGKRQPEAIALYKKYGYQIIPNYGPYIGVDNSVCFEKILTA